MTLKVIDTLWYCRCWTGHRSVELRFLFAPFRSVPLLHCVAGGGTKNPILLNVPASPPRRPTASAWTGVSPCQPLHQCQYPPAISGVGAPIYGRQLLAVATSSVSRQKLEPTGHAVIYPTGPRSATR